MQSIQKMRTAMNGGLLIAVIVALTCLPASERRKLASDIRNQTITAFRVLVDKVVPGNTMLKKMSGKFEELE
jgi:hypothetical protein